jgi:hypothetical protein
MSAPIFEIHRDPRPDDIAAVADKHRALKLLGDQPVALSSIEAASFNEGLICALLSILGAAPPYTPPVHAARLLSSEEIARFMPGEGS